jgi:hypothetical protein
MVMWSRPYDANSRLQGSRAHRFVSFLSSAAKKRADPKTGSNIVVKRELSDSDM